ncbi:MAG: ADP-ribosylglycohydrolase family protein [Caldilineaceae bacterium]|nr:ADP-ribosylglycohydrolase family protein [Caldilineaceae bacterium]
MERRKIFLAAAIWLIIVALVGLTRPEPAPQFQTISADNFYDKVYGAWKATMFANHAGLDLQGVYIEEPGPPGSFSPPFLEEWSTDDDTHVEWVDLHILETHGLDPTAEEIRLEWVDHLNHDIWVSTRRARDLMDEGLLPPETGNAENNPDGAWSIDAQLQTELFGMLAPGMPAVASAYAKRFAQVTNSGPAVEASVFFAALYSLAFFEDDVPTLIAAARQLTDDQAIIAPIVDNVVLWHQQNPEDWRLTRQLIRDAYDTDPMWWASRVNFAVTVMALLYGESDILRTIEIAALAGWDADNTMATAAGLLGLIHGYNGLPDAIANSTDIYFNEDVTGDLPRYDTVTQFAVRTQNLAEALISNAGGATLQGVYRIPAQSPSPRGRRPE